MTYYLTSVREGDRELSILPYFALTLKEDYFSYYATPSCFYMYASADDMKVLKFYLHSDESKLLELDAWSVIDLIQRGSVIGSFTSGEDFIVYVLNGGVYNILSQLSNLDEHDLHELLYNLYNFTDMKMDNDCVVLMIDGFGGEDLIISFEDVDNPNQLKQAMLKWRMLRDSNKE